MRYEANKITSNNSIWFHHADAIMALPLLETQFNEIYCYTFAFTFVHQYEKNKETKNNSVFEIEKKKME